jgi:hypothetical protein
MFKNFFQTISFFLILFIFSVGLAENLLAQKDELDDESWTVDERIGRYFYFTHGTAVWGHEFGFFKDPNECNADTIWLTFSSSEEKVKDFIGKDTVISLNVDGRDFKIKTPMLGAGTIGFTHVMTFTNLDAEQQLVDSLMKARHVKVMIVEPKELEVLLDIKEDQFGLEGFAASRKEAGQVCRDNAPKIPQKREALALIRQ